MKRCPITYKQFDSQGHYSPEGLRQLSVNLKTLEDLPYSADEQLTEAKKMASKMSIQGVQPKLSAFLDTGQSRFQLTEKGGTYIIKPQSPHWPNLPENEDLTMKLAHIAGIDVPSHGLVYCKDETLSYWIRRFDRPHVRYAKQKKVSMEDFAQLSEKNRQTKYNSSMEKVAHVIDQFCTFPLIEKEKLFRLTLFNFLVGNEDMHLKNFSLITVDGIIKLSPAYDLLNTTLAMWPSAKEEMALPISGKKNKLKAGDLIDTFGHQILGLNQKTYMKTYHSIIECHDEWRNVIDVSFLPQAQKDLYKEILQNRFSRLQDY